jgi:hypothetical protein
MILRNCLLAIAILLTPLEGLARALPPAGPDQKPQSTGTGAELQAKVDKLFAALDKPDSPGAALAIVRDGTVIYKRGYGIANLEYGIPITPATIFHVASVSKQFTAFAITLLAQQGKLSFDDDIRKYLPEVPDFGKTITINHLLHHTSGLRDQWELLAMAGWRLDDVITREHILKMVRHEKELNFDPGQEMLYCNTGFTKAVADIYLEDQETAAPSKDGPTPAPINMDPAKYYAYIGKYVLEAGPIVDFVRENGKLMAQFAGGAKAEALPESTLKFRIKAFEIGVTFSGLEKGRFSEITLEPRGQILHGKRAEPPDLVPAQLREYAGNYYSDELGTTYTLAVQDGKLVAQHRRHDDITLTPLDQDTFLGSQWFFQRVRFTRDKDGRVTGMRVTGGRARNMRFDRHP